MPREARQRPRVGIFAGTFDPIHTGHITFALQALQRADLDEVMFLPERRPRGKTAEHYGHRVAMLRRALQPHSHLSLIELVEPRFEVRRTLTHLRAALGDAELVFLMGSDVVPSVPDWPHVAQLLHNMELIVATRAGESSAAVRLAVATWPAQPRHLMVFDSFAPVVSGGAIRQALRQRRQVAGLLSSVLRYSRQNWLYVSLSN